MIIMHSIIIMIWQHPGLWMIVDVEIGITVEMPIERSPPSHPIHDDND